MSPRGAVTTMFVFNGFVFGSLYARMPALRDGLSLSDGELGLALLAVTLSLVLVAVPAGALVARLGSRPVLLAGALIVAGGVLLAGVASNVALFAVGLAIYGAGAACVDIPMNVAGLAVEARGPRRIFASLHAGFSFGALGGTALAAGAAAAGLRPGSQFAITAAVGLLAVAIAARALPEGAGTTSGPLFARPTRRLSLIGLVAFCGLFAEGSISDWGAILLHDEHDATESLAAAGLGVLSVALALGRLASDPLSERYGSQALVRAGGAVSCLAMALLLYAPHVAVAIGALLLLGFALSPIFPMTLRAAGAQGPAMAVATGAGYSGLMAGPPLIGGLSELTELPVALMLVVACCAAVVLLAPRPADN